MRHRAGDNSDDDALEGTSVPNAMFQIGQHVFIPSRMIGENKPGGVANIISVTGFAGASPLLPGVWYDVKYVVDNRVKKKSLRV